MLKLRDRYMEAYVGIGDCQYRQLFFFLRRQERADKWLIAGGGT